MTQQEALETLFQSMEKASGECTRDKGTRFETLVRDWLTKEPTYRDLFSEVLTYKEWSKRYPELARNSRDIGIDLVGLNANNSQQGGVYGYSM